MKNDEIQSVIDLTEFDSPAQEYARDVWLFLYLCNGINFADLLLMRWENIQRDFLIFFRKKTRNTRTKNVKEITAPIYEDLRKLIEKIGNKNSPFILGKLKEGYSENTFENKSHKMRRSINIELRTIHKKLNLSVPIKLGTARSSYATTLLRNGQSKTRIGEMLGHGSYAMIEHYCGGLDLDTIYEVNKSLYKNTPGFTPGNG